MRVQLDDHLFGPSRAQVLTHARFVDEHKDVGHGAPAFVKSVVAEWRWRQPENSGNLNQMAA